ncbi:hypothetical protein OIU78_019967 [Salix suchowensis]|nr:hypothetical protein OIU78_019967 [Salix suchowensis]
MAELFVNQAKQYAETRPSYPQQLFQFIASKTPTHDLVCDVGTGREQAARSGKHKFRFAGPSLFNIAIASSLRPCKKSQRGDSSAKRRTSTQYKIDGVDVHTWIVFHEEFLFIYLEKIIALMQSSHLATPFASYLFSGTQEQLLHGCTTKST